MADILELRNLTKHYKNLTAVDGLNLKVKQGICFGLLGPNGAGKTTTLEMIEGILPMSAGEILFRGEPIGKKFREEIGIQFQSTALPERIQVGEVLSLFASFYTQRADLGQLRKLCDLDEFWTRDASQLSGGQRQRVLLAVALVNDPALVFLDEPTTGLDPSARRNFWELVKTIRARGKTIVLTTHYMEEAYELCDEIAIMNQGKVIALGAPNRLLSEHFNGLSIWVQSVGVTLGSLKDVPGHAIDHGESIEIQTSDPEWTMRALLDQKVSLKGIQIKTPSLEDLFLKLAGKGEGHAAHSQVLS